MRTRLLLSLALCLASMAATTAPTTTGADSAVPTTQHSVDPLAVSQAIVLEAARQDVVDHRIAQTITDFQTLIAEMKANGSIDPRAEQDVGQLMARLEAARAAHVAKAGQLLRTAVQNPQQVRAALLAAESEVRLVIRELGSLLLRASTSHATEVAIDQLNDILAHQDQVQQETAEIANPQSQTTRPIDRAELPAQQKAVAEQVTHLLSGLAEVQVDGSGDSLPAVRLSRARALLESKKVDRTMLDAAADLERNDPAKALEKQTAAVRALREVRYKLEPGAETKALIAARDQLRAAINQQKTLRRQIELLTPEDFAAQAAALRPKQHELVQAVGRIFAPVDIDATLVAAGKSMGEAHQAIGGADRSKVTTPQVAAEESMTVALRIVEERIAELMKMEDLYKQLQAAMERARLLQEFEDRQQQIADETDGLGLKSKSVAHLAQPQQRLMQEAKQLYETWPDNSKWQALVRRPLGAAEKAMQQAGGVLGQNQASAAQPFHSDALKSLGEAKELANQEVAAIERQWRLLRLVSDLRQLARYLKDIEEEQADVREKTEQASAATQPAMQLASPQQKLVQAVTEVNDIVAMLDGATQLQEPLSKTQDAMTVAVAKLKANQPNPAVPLQKQAEALLREAQKLAMQIADQTDLLAEWTALMEKMQVDMLNLLQRQVALRKETEKAKTEDFRVLAGEQDILKSEADVFARLFETGKENYETAATEMAAAIKGLNAPDRKDAVTHQILAEEALARAQKQLQRLLEGLELIPSLLEAPPSAELGALMKAMMLAAKQRQLRYVTRTVAEKDVGGVAVPQEALRAEAESIKNEVTEDQNLLEEAEGEMAKAVTSLKGSARADGITHQQLAEKALRQYSLEQALKAFKLPEKMKMEVTMPGGMIAIDAPSLHLFSKGGIDGQPPPRTSSQWEPLGKRDRAALKENFARELPMEYRQLLRDYYEALSKEKESTRTGP